MARLNIFELLQASMETQTSGIPGAGSPLLLVSDPGIGKTALIRAFCHSIKNHCEVIIMGRIPSVDVGGIFVPDLKKGELKHLITKRLLGQIDAANGSKGICILFDEIGNTTEEQQTAVQSLIEDRCLEGHKVPDNVWFAFATNPTDSSCGSHEIVRSLLDRVIPVPITPEDVKQSLFPQWIEWALSEGDIHEHVIAYNLFKEGAAIHEFDAASEDMAQPSFRSWTKLSHILKTDPPQGSLDVLGAGCIGTGRWVDFRGWCKLAAEMPLFTDILSDPGSARLPTEPSGCYAVICNIAEGMRNRGSLTREIVEATIRYLRRLPETFAVYGFKLANRSHGDFSQKSDEFAKFCVDHKDLRI